MKRYSDKWLREKELRRLADKRDELWQQSTEAEYIPLEKPIFAGWDISVGFRESAKRRRDFEKISKILNVIIREEFFTRDKKLVRFIRGNNFKIESLRNYYKYSYYHLNSILNKHIDFKTYNNLSEEFKSYFYADRFYKYSTAERPYYELDVFKFPWYECRLIISKSYNYYKKIYNTEAKSEYDKLLNLHYVDFSKMWGRGYWRDDFKRSNKGAMRNSLRMMVSKQYTPDDILDDVNLFKGCFDKRNYGWN